MEDKIKNITAVQDEETKKQIQDLVERLSQAQSAEELAAICKETGCEIPLDKAQELYAQLEKRRAAGESGELTDEELESANGGRFVPFGIYHEDLIKK